ncbi:MAG: SDR family NAD(P)-dependent oxidoreductase, partial [Actinomycetota bacterium]|nr:SDR family NAD(P)-dependent oxidoreductase [Actinomycetota bacterium]
ALVALVAQDDVGEAAVAVLLAAPAHAGAVDDLTGPEALNLAEVADVVTRLTGHPARTLAEVLARHR